MSEPSKISSARLGLDAYAKAQGARRSRANTALALGKLAENPPNSGTRQLKTSVLNALHRQSNAGMVSIKDVATALDNSLKR